MRRVCTAIGLVCLGLAVSPVDAQDGEAAWLTRAAAAYRSWGQIDDELRWAPTRCRMPRRSRARVSRAGAPHGRKVYFVYASDRAAYVRFTTGSDAAPAIGLTVVKEAFEPRELPSEARGRAPLPASPFPQASPRTVLDGAEAYTPLADGERLLGAGEARGLYVLRFVGTAVPESDEGWIYGTLAPDGTATSTGRVSQCMACHRSAPHGRLFGLALSDTSP